jgi:hypothetical protein
MDNPALRVVAVFDGEWNTFDGSTHDASSGRWLNVRGRMTGNLVTLSYAQTTPSAHGGGVSSLRCSNLVGAASFSLPTPKKAPPPAWCELPVATSTGIHAKVRIDSYEGLEGTHFIHEHARATLVAIPWVYDASLFDTMHVELAMRVQTDTGLPFEIPLSPGDIVEVEGEYIPASVASSPNPAGGQDAVIHYTHAECGYAILHGVRYD